MPTDYYSAGDGKTWYLAKSLQALHAEIRAAFPDVYCLGTLGNSAHAAEAAYSDHNPIVRNGGLGVVRAIDFGGPDATLKHIRAHIWALFNARDARLWHYGYGKGCSDNQINNWPPAGAGSHTDTGDAGHLHVSVTQLTYPSQASGYVAAIDSVAPWGFASIPPIKSPVTTGGAGQDDDMDQATLMTSLAEFFSPSPTAGVPHSGEGWGRMAQLFGKYDDPAVLSAAVVAHLPAGTTVTTDQLETALRAVLGSVDGT